MLISRRQTLSLVGGAALTGALPAGWAFAKNDPPQIAVVVKIGGIPWFNAMEAGIKKVAGELKVNAWQVGPTQADAAQQVRAVEDLIAKKVDVIAVVPNDAAALEPVFKRAHDAGIYVITHESPDQKFNDWDIELTTPDVYGETHMEAFAKALGGKGKYIIYVGSLTVPLHNKWADYAIALQKKKYPEMELVADRFGVAESVDDSYKTALDQMRAHPDLAGILTFGSQGPAGAARAIEERGKQGKVILVGMCMPTQCAKYYKSGTITTGFLWNPTLAGEAIVRIGAMLASGQKIATGLEIPDVGKAQVDADKRLILVPTLAAVNKDTVDGLMKMGL